MSTRCIIKEERLYKFLRKILLHSGCCSGPNYCAGQTLVTRNLTNYQRPMMACRDICIWAAVTRWPIQVHPSIRLCDSESCDPAIGLVRLGSWSVWDPNWFFYFIIFFALTRMELRERISSIILYKLEFQSTFLEIKKYNHLRWSSNSS